MSDGQFKGPLHQMACTSPTDFWNDSCQDVNIIKFNRVPAAFALPKISKRSLVEAAGIE